MSRKRVLGVSTEKNIGKSANKAHRDLITFNSEFAKNESENEEEDNMNGDEHTSSHLYRLQSSQLSIAEPGGVFSSMRLRTQTNGSPTQTTHQTQHVHAQVKNTGKIVGNFSGNGNGNGNGKSVGKGKGKDKGALASTISSTHLTDNHRIVDISTVPPTLPFYTTDPTTTDYCIQRPIGAGGFAIVYKVIQMNRLTGTPVLLIPPSPTATSFSSSTSALSSSPCSVRRHIPASSITTSKSANNEHHLGFAMKSFHFMKAGDIVEVKVRVQSATQAYAQARAREDAHEMYAANTAITSSSNSSSSSNNKASRALMLRLTDIDNHPDYFTFQWKAGRISHVNKKGKENGTFGVEIFETGQPFHNAPLICIRLRPNVRSATFILRQQQQRHAQEQQEEEEAIAAAAAEVQVQSDRDREGGGKKSKLSGVAKEGAAHTTSPISTSTSNSSSNGRSDSEAGEDTDTSSSFAVGISSVWSRLRALISPSPTHPNNQESKHEEQRVGQVAQHITETTTAAKKSYEKRLELQNISKQLVLGQHGNAKNVGGGAYPGDYCYNNDDIKNLMRNAYKEIAILCKLEFHPCIPRVHSAYLEGLWGPNEEDKDEEDKGGQEEEKEEKKKEEEEEEEEKKKHEQGRGKRKSQTLVHPQRNMSGKALDKSSNDQKQHAQIQTRSLDFGHGYGQLKPHRQCPPLSYILPRINNGTKLFIIQEYLNGGDMFEAVDRWIRIAYIKKLSTGHNMEYLCRAFLKQILQGLLHIHNRGVIHRDIKLENIMLCDNTNNSHITGSGTGTANGQHTGKNQVKIIDFGLAMLAPVTPSDPTSGHKKQSQQPVGKNTPPPAGTKGYHSPEVLLYRDYTPACDIWATGVVLFLLLIRDYPFLCYSGSLNEKGQEWDEAACIRGDYLANLTTQKKVDTWNDLSLEAKHLIKRLLDVNPVTRITAKEALMHPWICGVHGTTSSGTSCSGKHSVDGHHQEHSLPAYADVDIDAIDMSNVGLNANTNSEPYIHTQTRLSPLYFSSMDPDHVQSLTSAEFAHVSNGLHASESASASSRLERLSEEEEVDEEEEEESSTNTVHPVSSSNSSKLHRKKATVTSTATGTCIDIDTGISSENADILSEIHSFRERQRAMLSTGLTVVRAAMRFKSKKATNPQVAKRREMEQDETEGRGTGAKSSIKRSKASSSIHSSTILKSTPQSRNTDRGTCTGNGTGTGTTGTDTSTDTGTDTGIGYHLSHV